VNGWIHPYVTGVNGRVFDWCELMDVQEYVVPDVHDRELLLTLHRQANKRRLDVSQYNELRDKLRLTEYDLQRLRDPLQLHLPAEYLGSTPTHTQ